MDALSRQVGRRKLRRASRATKASQLGTVYGVFVP